MYTGAEERYSSNLDVDNQAQSQSQSQNNNQEQTTTIINCPPDSTRDTAKKDLVDIRGKRRFFNSFSIQHNRGLVTNFENALQI